MSEKEEEDKETAEVSKKPKKEKSSPWGWLTGIFVAATGMLLIAGLSWWLSRKGRELAILKHKRDVKEAQAHVDKVNAEITKNTDAANSLILRATKKKMKAEAINKEVVELEKAAEAIKDQIDAIENWDGVDRYLAGKSSNGTT